MSLEQVAPGVVDERDALERELHDVGDGGLVGDLRRGQLGADHHLGQLAFGDVPRLGRADRRAAAHDGDVVGDGEHLVELVGDEQQRVAVGA